MELPAAIIATRALLREGETDKALQTILAALENNPRFANTKQTLQVLEASYHAAHQQEMKGILAFQEAQRSYNQVNDALLSMLQRLESGRDVGSVSVTTRIARWVWPVISLGVVVLALGIWYFAIEKKSGLYQDLADIECPVFHGRGPKVLILPFHPVGQGVVKPEDVVQSRIQIMAAKRNFSVTSRVLRGGELNPDEIDGEAICKHCEADMVVWGMYDYSDSLHIDLHFFTLNNPDGAFTTGFFTFKGLPDVQTGRMLSRLDDAILGVCGILAMRTGEKEIARAWFGKIKEKDATVQQMERLLTKSDSMQVNRPMEILKK